jgi:hypothetical protein
MTASPSNILLTRQQRRALERVERKSARKLGKLSPAGAVALGALLAAGSASATTFTVTNLDDSGPGSLRDAITQANDQTLNAGPDIIDFNEGLAGTITLTTGELAISDALTIQGLGESAITISGNNASRIFNIENSSSSTPIDVNINNLTLQNGKDKSGGAIRCATENLTLDQVTITGSTAGSDGGGIYFYGNYNAALTITNSTISGNTATSGNGGGLQVYHEYASIYLKNDTFTGNQAGTNGGGLNADLRISAPTRPANAPLEPAGPSFTMLNTVATNNTSGTALDTAGNGGGVRVNGPSSSVVTIADCVISGNIADPNDAASSPIPGTTSSDLGYGGGLYLTGGFTATVRRTTISGNTGYLGGGLYLRGGAQATVENSTIANNLGQNLSSPGSAGGVEITGSGTAATFNESTIAGNSAQTGSGGIQVESGNTATLRNSIVANNTAAANGTTPDISSAGTVTANFTLIKTPGTATIGGGTGNITGQDPQLAALANNASGVVAGATGSTQIPQTELPACGSPVIDAGDPEFVTPPSTDERNQSRVAGGAIDMGAAEFQASSVQFSTTAQSANEGSGSVTITAVRTGSDGTLTVNFATADGTAKGSASGTGTPDYTPQSGTLSWADGDLANKSFTVPLIDDNVFEGNKNFTVALSSPSACASLGELTSETVTIVDDETQPTIAIGDVSQNEGNSGTTHFSFPVTLSSPSTQTITVDFATEDGSATAGSDYTATSGTLTFAPGVTTQNILVPVTGDTTVEPDETFTVALSSPTNATIAAATGTGTIVNDDAAPTPTPTPSATPTPTPTPTPSPTPGAQALNVSARERVASGEGVLIDGFIITGDVSKKVLVRVIAPSLTQSHLTEVLPDPVLTLHGPDGSVILTNDNWKDTQQAEIEASGLPPQNDLESAIVATLPPGAYTAIVSGKNGATGVALVETYDLSSGTPSQLANISARGLVLTQDNVLIGGLVLGGSTDSSRVAIRGIGPSLSQAGVANPLADPTLDLRDSNGERLLFNDDFADDPAEAAELALNGLTPHDPRESGIFVTLPPGLYTVILAGKNGATGIALVEVYNLR